LRLYDDFIDVRTFKYVPGAVFATFLMAHRETAFLSAHALKYNFRTQWWHKRLLRYYCNLWACRTAGRDFEEPLKLSTIFREGLRAKIDPRCLANSKARFAECNRRLQLDGEIGGWRYGRQDGPWSEWTIIIEPPDQIRRCYEEDPREVPRFELPSNSIIPSQIEGASESIRARRESLGLSQRQFAKQFGISQSTLSRAESGAGRVSRTVRKLLG
jgi:hypothetical protein